MGGTYAGSGGAAVWSSVPPPWVLGCGDADAMRACTVENLADRVVVTVRNGSVPFALTLRPDGALSGSGTVEVAGRVVTGVPDIGPTFAPRTARCGLSTLTAR